jgi:hypothetical protein
MAEASQILRLDSENYDLSKVSTEAKALVVRLQQIDLLVEEKRNLVALLTKAKNAYIADIKGEIIKKKTGVDFSALFDAE